MTKKMETTKNDKGENVTLLDTGDGIKVWNHEHGVEIGTAGDPESARQMIND